MFIFRRCPALYLGMLLLVCAGGVLYPHWAYGCGFAALGLPLVMQRAWRVLIWSGVVVCVFAVHLWLHYSFPKKEVSGAGYFQISSAKIVQSPFSSAFLYQGSLRSFKSADGAVYKNVPCHIFFPSDKERLDASSNYLVEGKLTPKKTLSFTLKGTQNWQDVPNTFSLAEWRIGAKENVRRFLEKRIPHPRAAAFLVALTTGDLEERLLSLEFTKLGMQHILGISGFHFALLAAFLGSILRLIFPFKVTACILLLLLTFYFFFVGNAPAVLRGYVAITVFLLARLFHLNTSALNAMGAGLCIEILYDPLCITSIGFQLSFLCTWAILVVYPIMRKLLNGILLPRPLTCVSQMSLWQQHGYLCSALIREALALNLAVHLSSFPLILFLFHKFPMQSLIYNLFFPALFSLALLFLLVALLLFPISSLLFKGSSSFVAALLEVTAHPLPLFDFSVRVKNFPFGLVIFLLSLLFLGAMLLYEKLTKTPLLE